MDAELSARRSELRSLLGEARVIAVVGISSKPWRPSHEVAAYLQDHGYRIVPVNPNETEVLGERVFRLAPRHPARTSMSTSWTCSGGRSTRRRWRGRPSRSARALLWLQEGIVSEEAARIAAGGRTRRHHGRLHPERA